MHSSAFKWNFPKKFNVLSYKAGGGDIQFGFGPKLGSFYKEPPESQMSSKVMPSVLARLGAWPRNTFLRCAS